MLIRTCNEACFLQLLLLLIDFNQSFKLRTTSTGSPLLTTNYFIQFKGVGVTDTLGRNTTEVGLDFASSLSQTWIFVTRGSTKKLKLEKISNNDKLMLLSKSWVLNVKLGRILIFLPSKFWRVQFCVAVLTVGEITCSMEKCWTFRAWSSLLYAMGRSFSSGAEDFNQVGLHQWDCEQTEIVLMFQCENMNFPGFEIFSMSLKNCTDKRMINKPTNCWKFTNFVAKSPISR